MRRGVAVADVAAGRSARVVPSLKTPPMRPRATPCEDETTSEPDLAVELKPDASRAVMLTSAIWPGTLLVGTDPGGPGLAKLGASWIVCSAELAGSAAYTRLERT